MSKPVRSTRSCDTSLVDAARTASSGHEFVFGPEVVVGAMESNVIINAFQDGGRAGVLAGGMAGVAIQAPPTGCC